jgi:(4-O-methyl)-D-glucuronate---lignin esterase
MTSMRAGFFNLKREPRRHAPHRVALAALALAGLGLACSSDDDTTSTEALPAQPEPAPTDPGEPGSAPEGMDPNLPLVGGQPSIGESTSSEGCDVPGLPAFADLPVLQALPDPFVAIDGTPITSKAQWACRRAEISAQVQEYELGPKPPRPGVVSAALAGDQLTITAGEADRTIDFTVAITRPENAPLEPIPALIMIGGSSLAPVFASRGVATIAFNNGEMGAQGNRQEGDTYTNTRGQGKFYELYGADHGAGSMMAWAWGVSRIIDALEATPEANIDTRRLAVSGCSRNGKGALVVGAFDERIALTVPQESGAGGSASWRISQAMMDSYKATVNPMPAGGEGVQTLSSASGEQPWFRASFSQFGATSEDVARLPFDHHMVLGLVAPRALLVVDNTDMMWLGNESSFTDSVAAAEIWTGLGVQGAMGATQVGDSTHCTEVPQAQLDALAAFIDRYLVASGTPDTSVLASDQITPDRARWITWQTPSLE